jgi:hypothetical protein
MGASDIGQLRYLSVAVQVMAVGCPFRYVKSRQTRDIDIAGLIDVR